MKKIIYVTIVFSVIFLSCKKNNVDNDTTPAPATSTATNRPITRSDLYSENGYISGTIEGSNANGVAFTNEFKHELDGEIASYSVDAYGRYIIYLNKLDKLGRVGIGKDKQTTMGFIINSNKTSLYELLEFHTSIYLDSTATAITKFGIDASGNNIQHVIFSNVVFNTTDGKFACDYILKVRNAVSSSGYESIVTGKINTILTNIRYRTGS